MRRRRSSVALHLAGLAAWTALGAPMGAMQPEAAKFVVHIAPLAGPANLSATATHADTTITLLLENPRRDAPLLVVLPACTAEPVADGLIVSDLEAAIASGQVPRDARPFRPARAWKACMRAPVALPGTFLLLPGERRNVEVEVDFRAAGWHTLILNADVFALREAAPTLERALEHGAALAARQSISVLYEVLGAGEGGTFRRRSLDEIAALTRLPAEGHEGFASHEYRDGVDAVALRAYLESRTVVPELAWDPEHADVRLVEGGSSERPRRAATRAGGVPKVPKATTPSESGTGFIIKGRFSVRWADGLLHPGWGWQVRALWHDGSNWVELGRSIVTSDGSYWFVALHEGYFGQNLRVQVRAWNPFFRVVNQNDEHYRFNFPMQYDIEPTHDEGNRYLETEDNGLDGLGEVFDGGYQLYNEMFFRAKINPIREQPVRVYFPNTWETCGQKEIWSCAQPDGGVWILVNHATDRDVIQHELGHQMHLEFWNNRLPAGEGGQHNQTECYSRGQALVEGYATFVPLWTAMDRSKAITLNPWIEELGAAYCNAPGTENEGRVAGTLIDLHDAHDDGDDVIHFTKEGAVHAILFQNGPPYEGAHWGIDNLRVPYRNQASPPHRTIVDDIFQQNGTE